MSRLTVLACGNYDVCETFQCRPRCPSRRSLRVLTTMRPSFFLRRGREGQRPRARSCVVRVNSRPRDDAPGLRAVGRDFAGVAVVRPSWFRDRTDAVACRAPSGGENANSIVRHLHSTWPASGLNVTCKSAIIPITWSRHTSSALVEPTAGHPLNFAKDSACTWPVGAPTVARRARESVSGRLTQGDANCSFSIRVIA